MKSNLDDLFLSAVAHITSLKTALGLSWPSSVILRTDTRTDGQRTDSDGTDDGTDRQRKDDDDRTDKGQGDIGRQQRRRDGLDGTDGQMTTTRQRRRDRRQDERRDRRTEDDEDDKDDDRTDGQYIYSSNVSNTILAPIY